ncbi:hypothetical protein DPMN_011933 [Dreissena polymorpha]|uniref:THAP-type domain-containing protein n=1 Tax=Dreissena polymorpha TaxID=45954 RepID=A0A9D4S0T8_DREPO|nr:hypothetical protein DPMN_011933 [Dreissena polymorpha]
MGKKDFYCANGCSHDRSRGATCTFYIIPTDKELRSAWFTKIARVVQVTQNGKTVTKPWVPSKSSKLCGCHFENPPTHQMSEEVVCGSKYLLTQENLYKAQEITTKRKTCGNSIYSALKFNFPGNIKILHRKH